MNRIITLTLPGELIFARFASETAAKAALLLINSCDGGADDWKFTHAFELAVSEAFTNTVSYAQKPASPQPVTIDFIFEKQCLTVTIRDTNPPFSIETPAPDIESYPERGYGLLLMRTVMDTVTCARENGTNIISMSKQLNP
ncbi:MAG: ATP-binding protein [Chlorobiaceae bacterium]|nr:ATP-binding protein [Chlorobiaceae bacterium]